MRYLKIRWDGKTMEQQFEVERAEKDTEVTVFTSPDTPTPDFVRALAAFGGWMKRVFSLPKSWVDELEVRGIRIQYDKGVPGIIISAVVKFDGFNAPLVINTPLRRIPEVEEGLSLPKQIDDLKDLVALLEKEATRFRIDGHRQQMDIEDEAKAAEAETANA